MKRNSSASPKRRSLALSLWKSLAGFPGIQNIVLRLINAHFILGATAVILDHRGRVLLFHHTYRARSAWGLPGGWLKRGESVASALIREVAEESSMAVRIIAPLAVETARGVPAAEVLYLAEFVGGDFHPSGEVDECRWFAPGQDLPEEMKEAHRRMVRTVWRLRREERLPGKIHVDP